MNRLLILSRDESEYIPLLRAAALEKLEITADPGEADIILGEPGLTRDVLPRASRLKWVQSIYAGVEPLVDPAQRRDYVLTNARGVFGELMSEYVFGYLLFFEKKISERIETQKRKQWQRPESGMLRGKTIGLLGVGSIGAHLAETARQFKMRVRGYTRESEDSEHVDQYFHGDQLLQFAQGLDYLVSVLPRTNDTNQIVDANLLSALPPQAVFINVGRGNAVHEDALVAALNAGTLSAAVLDVFAQEPLPENHPFWTTPNLYMTFHTSAISYPEDITQLFIENYRLFLENKPLKHVVDFERGY